jgi:predicted alternative tryptophan synthase beta-subunit
MGPYFVQCEDWVNNMPELRNSVLNNLMDAEIIVVYNIANNIRIPAQRIIDKNFSEEPWQEVQDIVRQEHAYQIYFRKK